MNKFSTTSSNTSGFALFEVLIALLVISVGILGVASMQINSLRATHIGFMRTQATYVAYDMADRLRANQVGTLAGNYNGTPSASATDCYGSGNSCNNSQMAAYDKDAWLTALTLLPGGAGTVVDNGSSAYTIRVQWDEARSGATGTTCPPADSDDLRCIELKISLL